MNSSVTIRDARKAKGWTTGQLATVVGVGETHLSRIQSGTQRLTPALAGRLAAVLGVSAAALSAGQEKLREELIARLVGGEATAATPTGAAFRGLGKALGQMQEKAEQL